MQGTAFDQRSHQLYFYAPARSQPIKDFQCSTSTCFLHLHYVRATATDCIRFRLVRCLNTTHQLFTNIHRSMADQDTDRWIFEVLAPDLRRKMKTLKNEIQWTDLVYVNHNPLLNSNNTAQRQCSIPSRAPWTWNHPRTNQTRPPYNALRLYKGLFPNKLLMIYSIQPWSEV
jgi:hypothetical protein